MGQKKDIKLVKKLLKDHERTTLYTDEELLYMKLWLKESKLQRKAKKEQHKNEKGFGE